MNHQPYMGTGWSYPVSAKDGAISTAQGEDKVRQSIQIILTTAPGERVMRPDFGCGIHEYVFAPNNTRTAGLVRLAVEQALIRWEPRIDVESVEVDRDPRDPSTMFINIDYRVRETDSRFNMVFPFYLQREETV